MHLGAPGLRGAGIWDSTKRARGEKARGSGVEAAGGSREVGRARGLEGTGSVRARGRRRQPGASSWRALVTRA